jgi:hypothetical protein
MSGTIRNSPEEIPMRTFRPSCLAMIAVSVVASVVLTMLLNLVF